MFVEELFVVELLNIDVGWLCRSTLSATNCGQYQKYQDKGTFHDAVVS